MNRATADNQSAQSAEEGLEPTKAWVKDLIDAIIAEEFASPDLELHWLDEDDSDAGGAEAALEARVKMGAATLNELRAHLGLDAFASPAADRPMVLTASGYVPIEANADGGERRADTRVQIARATQVTESGADTDARSPAVVEKYNPNQPRVPAGSPDGGQWTREGGTGSMSDALVVPGTTVDDHSAQGIRYAALDTGTRTDASIDAPSKAFETSSDSVEPPVELAADDSRLWKPIDLREEEALFGPGHAISDHVGKTDAELLEAMERKTHRGWLFSYIRYREGSFSSIESANDFVNRTIENNRDKVDRVASGQEDEDIIQFRFGYPTGREYCRSDPDSEPYLRKTYSVGVWIVHDPKSPRGFRVRTAYPRND